MWLQKLKFWSESCLVGMNLVNFYSFSCRWQIPNSDNSVLASTANELRRDKYVAVNPEKLKAAAVGLSQSRFEPT